MRTLLVIGSAVFAFAATAAAQDQGAAIQTGEKDPLGQYLTDAEGMSLYMFMADTQGTGDAQAASACYDACAERWPPLAAEGEASAGENVTADMLGTIERTDGTMQVTYNGWPLYHYVEDRQPGDTEGQGVEEFGAEWYLLAPSGEVIHEEGGQEAGQSEGGQSSGGQSEGGQSGGGQSESGGEGSY